MSKETPKEFDFKSKVVIRTGDILADEHDAIVHFRNSHVSPEKGASFKIIEAAGPEMEKELYTIKGMSTGSVRLAPAYNLVKHKSIIHAEMPFIHKGLSNVDRYMLSLCYRNALDMTAEEGYTSIVFPTPSGIVLQPVIEIALATIARWLDTSPYANEFQKISVNADLDRIFEQYVQTAKLIEIHGVSLSDYFMGTTNVRPLNTNVEPPESDFYYDGEELMELTDEVEANMFPADETPMQLAENFYNSFASDPHLVNKQRSLQPNGGVLVDTPLDFSPDFASGPIDFDSLVYSENGIRLQLSRNLSTTILTLEEGDTGLVRQYRLTTQNQAGDTFYFRCSKCESLSKKTGTNYRPKITVRAGMILGTRHPIHHPDCRPLTKEGVVVQQIDRHARMRICSGRGDPREIYEEMRQRVPGSESDDLGESDEHFPHWDRVRKQYTRLHKYGIGGSQNNIILEAPKDSALDETLNAARKCEDEIERRNVNDASAYENNEQYANISKADRAYYMAGTPSSSSIYETSPELRINKKFSRLVEMAQPEAHVSATSSSAKLLQKRRLSSQPLYRIRDPKSEVSSPSDDTDKPIITQHQIGTRKYRIIRVRRRNTGEPGQTFTMEVPTEAARMESYY